MKRTWFFSALPYTLPLMSLGAHLVASQQDVLNTSNKRLQDISEQLQSLRTEIKTNEKNLDLLRSKKSTLDFATIHGAKFTHRLHSHKSPKTRVTSSQKSRSLISTLTKRVSTLSEDASPLNQPLSTSSLRNPEASILTLTETQFEEQAATTLSNIKKVFRAPTQEDIIHIILINFLRKLPSRNLSALLENEDTAKVINQRFALLIKKVNEIYPELHIQPEESFQAFYEKWKILLTPQEKIESESLAPVQRINDLSLRRLRRAPVASKRQLRRLQRSEDESWLSLANFQLNETALSLAKTQALETRGIATQRQVSEDVSTTEWNHVYFRLSNRAFSFSSRPAATKDFNETLRSTVKRNFQDTQYRYNPPTPFNISVTALWDSKGASSAATSRSERGSALEGLASGSRFSIKSFDLPTSLSWQPSPFKTLSDSRFTLAQEQLLQDNDFGFEIQPLQDSSSSGRRRQQGQELSLGIQPLPSELERSELSRVPQTQQKLSLQSLSLQPLEKIHLPEQKPYETQVTEQVILDQDDPVRTETLQEEQDSFVKNSASILKRRKKPIQDANNLESRNFSGLNVSDSFIPSQSLQRLETSAAISPLGTEPATQPLSRSTEEGNGPALQSKSQSPGLDQNVKPEETAAESKVSFY